MADITYVFEDASGRAYTRDEARELVQRAGRGWIARIRAVAGDGRDGVPTESTRLPAGTR
jgi:hypothetical protein